MKKGKPIEPGCLAMIVGSKTCAENNGRTVKVLRRLVNGEMGENGMRVYTRHPISWLVESLSTPLSLMTTKGRKLQVMRRAYAPKFLIRLDDDEEPKQETRVTETHKPKAEEVF